MSPLVSIITVVFNGAKTLEQTIQSVLGQTYRNIEYIIIDGGSADGTLEIIKKYENRIAHWVSESDRGLYDAMNKGIRMASGELIGIINSDDWYELNAVALIVNAYQQNPEKKIFHGDRYDVRDDGSRSVRRFNSSTFKFLYYGMTYNHPSMFIHRDVYQTRMYNPILRALSDYEFVLAAFIKDRLVFTYIPEAYVDFRAAGIGSQMKLAGLIHEGFLARKNAGMNVGGLIISTLLRSLVFSVVRWRKMWGDV